MTTPAWIGLGSNLGDRRAILEGALAALTEAPGVVVRAVSSYHETSPVGGPPGQGPFLNAAAQLETTLDPHQLLAVLQTIEDQAGRVRTVRWGERKLDLDILIYGTKFLDTKDLKLPHPRLAFRRFVLAPLAEIGPAIVDTMTRRTIADLLANLDRTPRLIALHGPPGRTKVNVFRRLIERLPALGIEGDEWTPDRSRDAENLAHRRESIAEKLEALRVARWCSETNRDSWGIATFFLDPRLIESVADSPPETFTEFKSMSEWATQRSAMMRWEDRIREAKGNASEPMFVVILPGLPRNSRKPGLVSVPQLWPDSDEPDAIVVEILATCRAIEGV